MKVELVAIPIPLICYIDICKDMANLIDTSFFYGKLLIAQSTEPSVALSITKAIDIFEPEFMLKLLGYELYKVFKAELTPSISDRMKGLRDGAEYQNRYGILDRWKGLKFTDGSGNRSPIANFVYYWYTRNNATKTTGTGEKNVGSKNSTNSDSVNKQCSAWNEMATWCNELWEFLYVNQDIYPEYFRNGFLIKLSNIELFKPINNINL